MVSSSSASRRRRSTPRVRVWPTGAGARTVVSLVAVFAVALGLAVPAAAGPPQALSCGAVVTETTVLADDVGPCPGDGLIIAADGITLDLNGHRVFGTFEPTPVPANSVNAAGISFQQVQGSTVRNGEVFNFAAGVRIQGGAENHVTRLNLHDNIGRSGTDGDGIAVFSSDGNRIVGNRVVHNGPWSGITLLGDAAAGSSRNVIAGNVVRDNNVPEFDDEGEMSWKSDTGIAIEGPGATHNQILGNVVEGSGVHGILVKPACSMGYDISAGCPGTVANDFNVIRGNKVSANGFGEPIDWGPIGDGITLLAMGPAEVRMPAHNTIEDNISHGNMRNGISLGGGNGEELTDATWVTGGEAYGCFRYENGDPDSPIVDSPDLCGVNDNVVAGNITSGNGSVGIHVGPRSDDNVIVRNTTVGNAMDGIAIGLAVQYDENQMPVLDANGKLVTIPGSAGRNNRLAFNTGFLNGRWDGSDANPGCVGNWWNSNQFRTVNQPCVE